MAVQFGNASALQVRMQGPYGSVAIRAVELTLHKDLWKGALSPYSQQVEADGVTVNSKIDLQPSEPQLEAMRLEGTAYAAVNDNGLVTVYAFGAKPRQDQVFQATVMEVHR